MQKYHVEVEDEHGRCIAGADVSTPAEVGEARKRLISEHPEAIDWSVWERDAHATRSMGGFDKWSRYHHYEVVDHGCVEQVANHP